MTKYILDDQKNPIPCIDLHTWGQFFSKADRIVKQTTKGDVQVSTVFLGLDHRFSGKGEPILFETMIFGWDKDPDSDYQERYCTWGEAEGGHWRACQKVWGDEFNFVADC